MLRSFKDRQGRDVWVFIGPGFFARPADQWRGDAPLYDLYSHGVLCVSTLEWENEDPDELPEAVLDEDHERAAKVKREEALIDKIEGVDVAIRNATDSAREYWKI